MKAIAQHRYGGPETLVLEELPDPEPGEDEVVVRVHAAGVNMADWHLMTGMPQMVRLATGLRAPRSSVRGSDVAGVIESVGARVTRLRPGDRVFGSLDGTFAELACGKADRVLALPEVVSMAHAAATPMAGYTALQALRAAGDVAGRRVLVLGAGGGVGSFTVQLAVAAGAHLTGVCSTAKVDLVRSLGAEEVVDYTLGDVTADGGRFDVVVDTGGVRPLHVLRALMAPRGTLVAVGGDGGGRLLGAVTRTLRGALISPFVRQRLVGLMALERRDDLEELAAHLAAGRLRPVISASYPLERAADAIGDLAAGRVAGKAVVLVHG